MDSKVVTVDSGQPVSECINAMLQNRVWSLVVVKKGLPVGVVTERDLIRRCIGVGKDTGRTRAEDVMSSPIITIDADAAVGEALQIMANKKVRRLYIIENGKVIARITQTDALGSMVDLLRSIQSLTYQM